MPFVAKFCPVKFGWENALRLNAMQKIYEDERDSGLSAYGGSVFYRAGYWSEGSCVQHCLLNGFQFSDVTGSVVDADRLSLKYLEDRHSIISFKARRRTMFHDTEENESNERALELSQIFTLGSKGTVLDDDANVAVHKSIVQLRRDLKERFADSSSVVETDVFSPAKYGERNAVLLNSLQKMQEYMMWDGSYSYLRMKPLIIRPSGTEFEADCLSFFFTFHGHADHIYNLSCILPETMGNDWKYIFKIENRLHNWPMLGAIKSELTQLRVSLYSLPRSIAFLMGRIARLRSAPVLPDDVCQLILALSLE
jgi:hypothetical protein